MKSRIIISEDVDNPKVALRQIKNNKSKEKISWLFRSDNWWLSYNDDNSIWCSPEAWFMLGCPEISKIICISCGSTSASCFVDKMICQHEIMLKESIDKDCQMSYV